tara:strand:+ start:1478 stop:2014 length:537 start_codon:yes stop_codon:yes gene_type:complete
MKLSFFLLLIVILILTHLSKKENFTNVDIPIEEIPFNDSDDIFRKCVNKIKKGNTVNKLKLIKCSHQYCANMRSTSADGGAITTNLIPIEPLEGKGPTKEFYISVCCTSDYCRMLFDKSHKYIHVGNNYYLVKTNNNYGNKVVQILFTKQEDEMKEGLHLSGLSGNLTLKKIKEICKI